MSEDLRVVKTKDNICQRFTELLEKYQFHEITVKMLIEKCRINRSTFYRNYEDKFDLLGKISHDILNEYTSALNPEFIHIDVNDKEKLKPFFKPLIKFFNNHRRLLNAMWQKSLPVHIFDDMHFIYSEKILNEMTVKYRIKEDGIKLASYFSKVIASNILTAIKWWHDENPKLSENELLAIISISVTEGVLPSLKINFTKTN